MIRQQLLIDADDTLWENNVYYEAVIGEFLGSFNSGLSLDAKRTILNEIELSNLATRGYGTESFGLNLRDACHRLSATPPTEEKLEWAVSLARRIADHEIELLDGVEETLRYLKPKHDMILVTKGQLQEQVEKVKRSGLESYFDAVEVVSEKKTVTYLHLTTKHGLTPSRSWMIGNSPRSDINPALAAGLNAILIPHDFTWMLEEETLASGPGRLRILECFPRLQDHF